MDELWRLILLTISRTTAKTASYVSVFNLNQDDPGYFEIGRVL